MCKSEDDHFSNESARRLSPRHHQLKQSTALRMTKRSCGTSKVLTGARVPGRWSSVGCSVRVFLPTRASSAHKIFGNSHKTKDIGLLVGYSRHCQPSQVHVRDEDEAACDDLHVLHTSAVHAFALHSSGSSRSKFSSAVWSVACRICASRSGFQLVAYFSCPTGLIRIDDFLTNFSFNLLSTFEFCRFGSSLLRGGLNDPVELHLSGVVRSLIRVSLYEGSASYLSMKDL